MIKDIAKLGVAAALIGMAPLAFAQSVVPAVSGTTTGSSAAGSTYTTGTTGTTGAMSSTSGSTTPGVPNTGAGGDASTNIALLVVSGAVVLAGVGFLATRRGVRA